MIVARIRVPRTSGARLLLALVVLTGCAQEPAGTAAEFGDDTACALDGMLLAEFPGPKAQILYATGEREFYCDTVEMFAMLLAPESGRRVQAVFTQDMAHTPWDTPRGAWIDARSAWYVHGGDARGSMGPTFAAFAQRADAEAWSRAHGGRVLAFAEVTPELADLRGGAQLDGGM